MASDYLTRDDAPFGEEIFAKLDGIVASVASAQLSARRLLGHRGTFRARIEVGAAKRRGDCRRRGHGAFEPVAAAAAHPDRVHLERA